MHVLPLSLVGPLALTWLLATYRAADGAPPLSLPISIVVLSYFPVASIQVLAAVDHYQGTSSHWTGLMLYPVLLLAPWIMLAATIAAAGLLLSGRGRPNRGWHVAVLFV